MSLKRIVAFALAAIVIAALMLAFEPVRAQPGPNPTRWSYKVVHSVSEQDFSTLGRDGWELCAAIGRFEGNSSPVTFIFKRQQ